MIIDLIKNYQQYFKNDYIKKAFEFVNPRLKDGEYEILGRDIYAIVSSYQTIDMLSAKLESHEKYIDIQIMLEGEERFYCINKSNLKPKTEYIKERDVKFYKKCFNTTSYFSDNILRPDSFILFYPEDAHMPKLKTNNVDKNVRKIVIKIKKELLNV